MEVYNNPTDSTSHLYVGTSNTAGCELWRSIDGKTWEPVISYSNWIFSLLHNADFPRGFGRHSLIDGIRCMSIYSGDLYVGTTRLGYGYVTYKNLFPYLERGTVTLKIPPIGAQMWKYSGTKDQWEQVIGGLGREVTDNGFGDSKNIEMWSIETLDNTLYVGTMYTEPPHAIYEKLGLFHWMFTFSKEKNIKIGGEIWATQNGKTWIQLVGDEAHLRNNSYPPNGFGDFFNGMRVMEKYILQGVNRLVVGTLNQVTGCEVWMYTPIE